MTTQRLLPTLQHHTTMIVAAVFFMVSAIMLMMLGYSGPAGIGLLLVLVSGVPRVVEKVAQATVPVSLQVQYAVLLLIGPYIGGALGLYRAWYPWDTIVHFYSGIPLTLAIIWALGVTLHRYQLSLPLWLEVVMVISVKAIAALLWEFGELLFDLIFDTNTQNHNFDTMTDMLASLTPALVITGALTLYRRHGQFQYIGSLITAAQGRQ